MATENTKVEAKELTIEEKLRSLYDLQVIVSEIDKIKILRGELPLEVQDLEDEIAGLQTRIENFKAEIKASVDEVKTRKSDIENAKSLIEKYKSQQDNVRNNREFDFLNKEIEYQGLEIEFAEKKIKEAQFAEKTKTEELAAAQADMEERQKDLDVKKAELEDIISETRTQEEHLRERAAALEENIDARLLTAFKRIRKNARNGLAVVTVDRDACSGCYNKIPPQRQMDIRMRKKVIVCEYCGRIMVDPELAKSEASNVAE
ncbi:MAG: hypothetical protein IJR64_08510 [Bacteroidales bacterium]|nr:hypothetical protein [Bacteroidales bacterium]